MTHSEAPPPRKQSPRIGFAAAFGLGVVPVALLLVVHGRSGDPVPAQSEGVVVASAASPNAAPPKPAPPARVATAAAAAPALVEEMVRPASEEDYFRTLKELRRAAPERALAWVERGQEWYGAGGEHGEARTAMQVTLLVELDRMRDARAVVDRFIVEHPESPYRPLVQGMTGIHPRPGPPASVAARRP